MRALVVLALVVPLTLAGCATDEMSAAQTQPRASDPPGGAIECPAGSFLTGIDRKGDPTCSRAVPAFSCPEGEFLVGYAADGTPRCGPAEEADTPAPRAALSLVNVYGTRPGTDVDLNTFKVNVEVPAGSAPVDLGRMMVRWSDGAETSTYLFGRDQDNATSPPRFEITCIRGSCSDSDPVAEADDLVEIVFSMRAGEYAGERESHEIALVADGIDPVVADLKTPSTYGTDLVITLR